MKRARADTADRMMAPPAGFVVVPLAEARPGDLLCAGRGTAWRAIVEIYPAGSLVTVLRGHRPTAIARDRVRVVARRLA